MQMTEVGPKLEQLSGQQLNQLINHLDITPEQLVVISQLDQNHADQLLKDNDWATFKHLCSKLQKISQCNITLSLENIKFYFAYGR